MNCFLCPRKCGTDRSVNSGYCGTKDIVYIARATAHHWEEPCISGEKGSGTVFFSGCPLHCVYCQNKMCIRDRDSPDCFEQNCIFLKDDIIIMVSDGFECDKQVLKECCKNMKDCLGAANAIAEKSNKPNDDVTVIVAKIA